MLLLLPAIGMTTIIIPPADMGQLAHDSDAIVYGTITNHINENPYLNSFDIISAIKGIDKNTHTIIIEEYGGKRGEWINTVSGDTDYLIGKKYLLFLFKRDNGHYRAKLMALGVYMQLEVEGKSVFLHEKSLREIYFVDEESDISGLKGAYEAKSFIFLCY